MLFLSGMLEILNSPSVVVPIPVIVTTSPIHEEIPDVGTPIVEPGKVSIVNVSPPEYACQLQRIVWL